MATVLEERTEERTLEEILALPPGTVTYDDYAQLPEGAPYQLIEGKLIHSPARTPQHQIILVNVAADLHQFARKHQAGRVYLGPIDVFLGPRNTPQPDVIFIRAERLHIIGDKKIEGAPDIVVEVLSPKTAYYDLKKKKKIYEAAGVPEYWIVDPIERSVEVFALEDGAYVLFHRVEGEGVVRSKVLPELSLDLADGFTL